MKTRNIESAVRGLTPLTKILSSTYSILLISIYIVIIINKFTQDSPKSYHDLESYPLLIYLTLVSSLFLLYLLIFLTKPPRSHQNRKSHGSAFLRQGAVVFGAGSVLYFISHTVLHIVNIKCSGEEGTIRIAIELLVICMFILQIATIVTYPRLNLDPGLGAPHFGLMHLVATNVIIWIRTVIKESIEEFEELTEKEGLKDKEGDSSGFCEVNEDHVIYDILRNSTPILFAFIIEFALIGATVFYNMWHNVQLHELAESTLDSFSFKPNIKEFIMKKTDWRNALHGGVAGIVVLGSNILSLGLFLHFSSEDSHVDEYIEKSMRIISNILGIVATLAGFWHLRKMARRTKEEETDVDKFLLNLGAAFTFIYMSLCISVGIHHQDSLGFPSGLMIANGILSVIQVVLQLVFINLILNLVPGTDDSRQPGRQFTTFLVLLNFTLWLVNTFELQKNQASTVESSVYGTLTWVWLQRLTLPLVIFFRFHSTVVLIDCWKNSYKPEEE